MRKTKHFFPTSSSASANAVRHYTVILSLRDRMGEGLIFLNQDLVSVGDRQSNDANDLPICYVTLTDET